MKPDKIHDDLAIIKDHLTLQKLAKHNKPLFVISMGSFAISFTLFTVCCLSGLMAVSLSNFFAYIAFAFIFAGIFLVTTTLLLYGPKGVFAKRYSKQLEKQNLDELSVDELHTLIDFHHNQKNFEAADRVSKFLMLKLDDDSSN